jgi:uncharacterized protein YjdB
MRLSSSSARVTRFTAVLALLAAIGACDSHIGEFAGVPGTGPGTDTSKVATVTVSPPSATLTVGTTQTFSATARNAAGTNLSATILWSSSNTAVATVDQSGSVRAAATGSATITATAGGIAGHAAVTVSGPTPPR